MNKFKVGDSVFIKNINWFYDKYGGNDYSTLIKNFPPPGLTFDMFRIICSKNKIVIKFIDTYIHASIDNNCIVWKWDVDWCVPNKILPKNYKGNT